MKNKIQFTVFEDNTEFQIETFNGEYRNLMALLNDKIYLDSFGECGGVGRCATCTINIIGISGNSVIMERNEPATLSRFGNNDKNIRLACQILITNDLEGSVVNILE